MINFVKKSTIGRIVWIDVAKCLAITAVMIDHTSAILGFHQFIISGSLYSVSLFVIIMGVTMFGSLQNCTVSIGNWLKKRVKGILDPYVVAVIFIILYKTDPLI